MIHILFGLLGLVGRLSNRLSLKIFEGKYPVLLGLVALGIFPSKFRLNLLTPVYLSVTFNSHNSKLETARDYYYNNIQR